MKRVCNTSILVILSFFCAGKFVTLVICQRVCQSLTLSSLSADRQDICLMLLTHTTANRSALNPTRAHPHPSPRAQQNGALEEELQANYYAAYASLMLRTVRACTRYSAVGIVMGRPQSGWFSRPGESSLSPFTSVCIWHFHRIVIQFSSARYAQINTRWTSEPQVLLNV